MDGGAFFLSTSPDNFYGIIAGKRIGSAVIRNLVRRRLKEAIHYVEKELAGIKGMRLVVVAKTGIVDVPFEKISKEIHNVVKNAIKEKPGGSCFNG